ncbi:MAG: gamma-glutamyl-gamma-aminobutyrate hydrolase family protein [Candidatus Hydrogenedentes bacterium]|nr:gamma-glutamyl-gamma-aminobutyrate hydrolase family protein [Candidatus Hydrogenedentota bacterium]
MKRPLIGVTSDYLVSERGRPWSNSACLASYADALDLAGAIPMILPLASKTFCGDALARLDGIILSGGDDIPAEAFGQTAHPKSHPLPKERWDSECMWLNAALDANKPVLGICLGMQTMCVAAGAEILQDIPDLCPNAFTHGTPSRKHPHEIDLVSGTMLSRFAPTPRVSICSSHHQAVKSVPAPYTLAALSPDGIIEAVEDPTRPFVVGVQWHPERNDAQPDWLLTAFVQHCAETL